MARGGTGWVRTAAALLMVTALPGAVYAQAAPSSPPAGATPATPTASATTPPAVTPPAPQTAPSVPAPPTTQPAPAPPPATGEVVPDKPSTPDTSISQTLDLPARPALVLTGKASWDDGFKAITEAFGKLDDAVAKNGLTTAGHPMAVFTETDDNGFSFSAELPIEKLADGRSEITPEIKVGETPSGKAMRFQHRGSYEEIDSTYEAITAYLDEKGLESRNLFAEEYLDKVKSADDGNLEVDIYVFLK